MKVNAWTCMNFYSDIPGVKGFCSLKSFDKSLSIITWTSLWLIMETLECWWLILAHSVDEVLSFIYRWKFHQGVIELSKKVGRTNVTIMLNFTLNEWWPQIPVLNFLIMDVVLLTCFSASNWSWFVWYIYILLECIAGARD